MTIKKSSLSLSDPPKLDGQPLKILFHGLSQPDNDHARAAVLDTPVLYSFTPVLYSLSQIFYSITSSNPDVSIIQSFYFCFLEYLPRDMYCFFRHWKPVSNIKMRETKMTQRPLVGGSHYGSRPRDGQGKA